MDTYLTGLSRARVVRNGTFCTSLAAHRRLSSGRAGAVNSFSMQRIRGSGSRHASTAVALQRLPSFAGFHSNDSTCSVALACALLTARRRGSGAAASPALSSRRPDWTPSSIGRCLPARSAPSSRARSPDHHPHRRRPRRASPLIAAVNGGRGPLLPLARRPGRRSCPTRRSTGSRAARKSRASASTAPCAARWSAPTRDGRALGRRALGFDGAGVGVAIIDSGVDALARRSRTARVVALRRLRQRAAVAVRRLRTRHARRRHHRRQRLRLRTARARGIAPGAHLVVLKALDVDRATAHQQRHRRARLRDREQRRRSTSASSTCRSPPASTSRSPPIR